MTTYSPEFDSTIACRQILTDFLNNSILCL